MVGVQPMHQLATQLSTTYSRRDEVHLPNERSLQVLRGHVHPAGLLPFGLFIAGCNRLRHGRLLDLLTANHAAYDDPPPAPDHLILGRVDERIQTAVAVGEHGEQQVECCDSGHHVETREDRVGFHCVYCRNWKGLFKVTYSHVYTATVLVSRTWCKV